MAIERLEGFAIAAAVVGRWGDHTYVTSSGGSVWPCWGRGAGGTALPGGTAYGEQTVADCISQQASRAGIAYGLTGVCHQTANRVLFPATGASVMQARGYWASHLVFGDYGLPLALLPPAARLAAAALAAEDWLARQIRCMPPVGALAAVASLASRDTSGIGEIAGYLARVNEIHQHYADFAVENKSVSEVGLDFMRQHVDLAVELRLGSATDLTVRDAFRAAYASVFNGRQALVESLVTNEIGPGAYFAGIDDLVADALRGLSVNVGVETCARYFGVAPQQRLRVVDPDIGWPHLATAFSEAEP